MGRIGRRVGDRYRLVEKLGTGGMSEVWRGLDETLGREVAVKVLAPQLAADDTFRDRMRQEALAAARLCHPHITSIFDFGESPLPGVTVPYVVMELNDGESVAARVRRDGPLAWREAVTMAAEVASALATAHARGIVHRDVTPANVMLTRAGAKVVDFGISALVGQRDAAPDGSLLGTPAYLAPERLGGAPVSPATDVYALGVLLYRSLAGRLPWPAENTAEALRAHLYADPDPVPAVPGLPDEVARLCLRCLAKTPSDRPGAAEVAYRLAAAVGIAPVMPPVSDAPTMPIQRPLPVVPPRLHGLRALRLRAGLRLLPALRLGDAKPLGGGLFQGGQVFAALSLTGRHRMQAGVATVAMLAAVGVGWSFAREPAEVGPAQASAAGVGTPAGVVHTAGCTVRYHVEKDTGADFEAEVTVVNNGERTVEDWRMEFAYPGTQRLTDPARAVAQNGRKVVVNGRKDLGPGRSASIALRGAYRGSNPLPLAFTLDGQRCEAQVVGARTPVSEASQVSEPAQVAPAKKKASSFVRKPERKKASKTAPKVSPKVEKATPAPGRPSPEPIRVGGFSVSI